MSKTDLFVTSDTKQAGQGIYRLTLDRLKGKLEGPWLYYECAEAKALSRYHYELAVVCAKPEHAGVALLDTHQPIPFFIASKLAEETPPCSITQDSERIYTVNDREGNVMVYHKEQNHLRLERRIKLGAEAKCRQLFLLDQYLYIVCAGWDRIRILNPQDQYAVVRDIPLPKESGPCFAEADAWHRYLYVLCETSNEIFVFQIGAHCAFRCHQIISVLPPGCRETCVSTALHISPNAQFLYTATAGIDVVTSFAIINGSLLPKEIIKSGGVYPSDLILDDSGRWLIVLNRDSDRVILFQCHPETGETIAVYDEVKLPKGTAITFAYHR